MTEKIVVVHEGVIKKWLRFRGLSNLSVETIERALGRIEEVKTKTPPDLLIEILADDPRSDEEVFSAIPRQVGVGNSVLLFGGRRAICIASIEEQLDRAGITYREDTVGVLD